MAYEEGLAQILRDALIDDEGITEKKMFGGLVFMLDGNMLCGVHTTGGMFRVGKDNEAAALEIEGAREMDFTRRKMGGFIDASDEAVENDDTREALISLARQFVGALPPK